MANENKRLQFERLIMPHVDAAYNLAHWLMRDSADAEEAAQEAFLRAYKFFGSFRGEEGKAWLLAIVRNTCYTMNGRNQGKRLCDEFDEQIHLPDPDDAGSHGRTCRNPEDLAIEHANCELVNKAIGNLPVAFREVLIMRELEDLSYKEIAKIIDVPLGTVMSRLARGRSLLQQALAAHQEKE